ncbi:MAG: anhydro-N-acetylmuramic acid kinase [Ignavibacteriae bacterium HGW-Ignavibacteriae-4]|jgi:anhydro-N-acetylmuramic acid kinase|nr:MAG: anhydro-N-acetylmuramic acid kinase [Ignavibacteriae bacterium HGW-Ignavibacteriae-4]
MSKELYIGIMTGTSVDAIDIASASFASGSITDIVADEFSFTSELQSYLKSLTGDITLKSLSQLNIRYTEEIAVAVNEFLSKYRIEKSDVKAIGFHGQTLWHQPELELYLGEMTSSTYQLGSATHLAILTGIDTVGDFRTADMTVGGQGAPLIPIFDYAFLSDKSRDTIVLNIGGIANITYLPAGGSKDEVIAFDTGAGNCLIDLAMKKLFDKDYDKNGETGRNGKLNEATFNSLMSEPFIDKIYPKSTGKELFNTALLAKHKVYSLSPEDAISTLTHFTAKSIAQNIDKVIKDNYTLKIAGGGARNSYMVELINHYSPNAKIERPVLNRIDISDSREALLMAYLAYLRLEEQCGNMPTVTGSTREVILGSLAKG